MRAEDKRHFGSWEQRYQETPADNMPWYSPDLDPDARKAIQELNLSGGGALDLGTGPGTQAIGLATIGFEVTATDISPTAIDHARARAEAKGVDIDWRVDDILRTSLTEKFDIIFDRGCFHVLDVDLRDDYVAAVIGLLNDGGYLMLKTFSVKEPEPAGPYRFAPGDIQTYFSNALEINSIRETVFQGNRQPLPQALFAVMRLPIARSAFASGDMQGDAPGGPSGQTRSGKRLSDSRNSDEDKKRR